MIISLQASFKMRLDMMHVVSCVSFGSSWTHGSSDMHEIPIVLRLGQIQVAARPIPWISMSRGPTGPLIAFPSWTRPIQSFSYGF